MHVVNNPAHHWRCFELSPHSPVYVPFADALQQDLKERRQIAQAYEAALSGPRNPYDL